MTRRRLRALAPRGVVLLVLGLSGCTAAGGTVTVSGKTLTLYVSAGGGGVAGGSAGGVAGSSGGGVAAERDVLAAEQLAFDQLAPTVTAYKLRLRVVSSVKPSNNARTAIVDATAVAYLGEDAPGDSAASAGITNAEDLLQVSPTDTAVELTQPSAAVKAAPNTYYESLKTYGRTFARVVPNTAKEARAQVQEMSSLGVKRLYVASDASDYGKAIALALRQAAAPRIAITPSADGADGAFYGSNSASAASAFFTRLAGANPRMRLFGASAIAGGPFPPSLRNVYVSSPGFLGRSLPSGAAQSFVKPFTARYHRAPSSEAIFGYETMAAVLAVLHEAGSQANDRATVVHDFFAIRNRASVLGSYSINLSGDTNLAPFVFSAVRSGRPVPIRFVQVQG